MRYKLDFAHISNIICYIEREGMHTLGPEALGRIYFNSNMQVAQLCLVDCKLTLLRQALSPNLI